MQVPRPFAIFFPQRPFGVQKSRTFLPAAKRHGHMMGNKVLLVLGTISFPLTTQTPSNLKNEFYLSWMQVPRPFAVFFPQRPFGVQNWFGDFLLSFFLKKDAKKSRTFFVLQKDVKKTPKRCQKVSNLFLDTKRFPSKKVGKKSWHLRSP